MSKKTPETPMATSTPKTMLDCADIMERYHISHNKAHAMMRQHGFPSFMLGNKFLVRSDLLEKWENDQIRHVVRG